MSFPENISVQDYITEASRLAWDLPHLPRETASREIRSVGVIGAGTMGGGIAMNFATVGLPVSIVEQNAAALERGLNTIRGHYARSAERGRITKEDVEQRMDLLQGSTQMSSLADCDLVIEAAYENMDVKKEIFRTLDNVVKQGAILATNTSGLNIDEIAAQTSRPQDVIGLHFFSPANVMKLLEIVQAGKTAPDVLATAVSIAKTIGKVGVVVGVCNGFVGNRMLWFRQRQAMALLFRGALPWDIDEALTEFGFRMGPFQMGDLSGLDLFWTKGKNTDQPIRDALCELDRRGQKTRAGYYDYDEKMNRTPSDVTAKVIRDLTGKDPVKLSKDEIVECCIFPMINEAVKILEENKAQRPSDVDVIWLNGYGWPPEKGGPLFYADTVGAKAILDRIEKLSGDPSITPAPTLKKLAAEGGRFIDLDFGGLAAGVRTGG